MDINDLRSLVTVSSFIAFVAIVWWAWSGRKKADFEAAARLPLEDGDGNAPTAPQGKEAH